ncbi:phosphoribosylamine--glycine ligase [Kamptonema animale CS-326]|uniref:phosphoribosylamine--glycine ligase n=1 Tax=Kamptonema animale TaxID=92934 RepID=UPI00232D598D|nr:phosphoribosylamine--glycine ligase [Kamptonema animale]MDB9510789.1 phosphoribosylamine--glycine ligase [Kamptonema animale CS-326]
MKVLVVGNGGREHAIATKLLQSGKIEQVFCVPGNGGTATLKGCHNLPLPVDDFEGMERAILEHDISLVAVGPEVPLSLGIADYFQQRNIPVFGPIEAGAQIEASKSWAKDLMLEAGIPTAKSGTFTDADSAKAYIAAQGVPIVVKADGLAAGKGVTVATTLEMAESAIDAIFGGEFGSENIRAVVEEFLSGQEVSILALTDGLTIVPLLPAQDHKAIGNGDTGPNTGGMGAYAPAPIVTPALMQRIQTEILQPTLTTLQKRGIDYRGVLYAGLMISPEGEPKVLEFNCRFGDPETQPILSLLETPLEDIMLACCQQRLDELPALSWKPGAAVCVVLAAGGYPGVYEKCKVITGIEQAEALGATVFHAGTKLKEQLITDGGRVLGVTAIGETFEIAIKKAYAAVDCIQFEGAYCRRDIGHRAMKN